MNKSILVIIFIAIYSSAFKFTYVQITSGENINASSYYFSMKGNKYIFGHMEYFRVLQKAKP